MSLDAMPYVSPDLAPPPRSRSAIAWSVLLVGGAMVFGNQIVSGGPMIRLVVAVVVVGVLAIPAIEHPKKAVMALFVLLPFLGVVRHLFTSATGRVSLDPLLLITSAVAILIMVALTLNDELDFGGTALSKVVFCLMLVGAIQVFNPDQGGLLVGLTGVMIVLVPMGFFFIGRSLGDLETTHRLMRIIMVIGVIAGLYGLSQVFFGFRGFEQRWLSGGAPISATVGQTVRPFSIFNNAAEYAAYAHYAFTCSLAAFLFAPKARRTLLLAVTVLIGYAGFLIGSRGFTVKIGLAIVVLLAARAKNRLLAAGIVIMLVSAAVFWSTTTTSSNSFEDQEVGAGQLIEQQLRALRDPLDANKSTLPVHFKAAREGVVYAITQRPLGLGTGVATRGGEKFGGLQAGTEFDVGDIFLSMGVMGGLLYVAAIFLGILYASRVRRALPGPVWTAVWAIAVTSVGAWMNGGLYAVMPLLWYLVGAADGQYKKLRDRGLMRGALKP